MYPPNLCLGLFNTSAIDNIDHNPGSTTATDVINIMGITAGSNLGKEIHQQDTVRTSTGVHVCTSPLSLLRKDAPIPSVDGAIKIDGQVIHLALQEEMRVYSHTPHTRTGLLGNLIICVHRNRVIH